MSIQPHIAIVTDSAASIPEALRQQYNIEVAPIWVNMDKVSCRSGIDMNPETFFAQLRANPEMQVSTMPKTKPKACMCWRN